MKRLQCEMCGGVDLIKQDGVFVCQSCGVKYSTEEARKMMVEIDGTVEVHGTVEVDTSKELDNLYQIARRARDDDNRENAAKYYDMILIKDPSSWEAAFYTVYFKAMACKIAQISSAGKNVSNCIDTVLKLIKDNVKDEEAQKEAYTEVSNRVMTVARMLFNGASNYYIDTGYKYPQEWASNSLAAVNCVYVLGDNLDLFFGSDTDANSLSVNAWRQGIEWHLTFIKNSLDKDRNRRTVQKYASKVKKYDADYTAPKESGGCYIATCVYGSYDCPQVWALRRYRDDTLASTWYGRAFIRTYYAVSPTIVKLFGDADWFKNVWKKRLDKLVSNLRSNGVEDTPYQDQNR